MNCVTGCSKSSRILRQIYPPAIGTVLARSSAIRTCGLWKRRHYALTLFPVVSSTRCIKITMADATDSPSKPSVTAIALSKKNLPSFSQRRSETGTPGESERSPDDGAETFLRSVLGIGHKGSDSHTGSPLVTEQSGRLPRVDSVSAEDPAIVGWSLHAEAESAVLGLKTEGNPCSESDAEDSTKIDVPTRKSRRKSRKKRKARAAVPEDDETDDIHSPGAISKETAVEDEGNSLIAELPAGAVSCSTEDENDIVYSLKPLFTGAFDRAGKGKKSKRISPDPLQKRPNYFVALQVNDVVVHKAARRVQEHLCSVKPEIVPFLVPVATLHITVLVLRIEDDNTLQRAKDALLQSHMRLKDNFDEVPLLLEFKGLASFGGKVLYIKTANEEARKRLQTLADVCLEEFTKAELDLSGHKEFRPHLTLAKLSRVTKREKAIPLLQVVKRIEEEWYGEFAEETFGCQRVNGVQLLSMNKPKDEHGYYYNSLQLDFGGYSLSRKFKH
ncbi:unnamed protein product, partial [Ixodes hexagonus]